MHQLDTLNSQTDDQLLMNYVICDEPDLLYLDTFLRESLKTKA